MLERYTRPPMKRLWSEEHKYDLWLKVEIAVCEAWAEEGVIPPEDMEKLRHARYNMARLQDIFQRTRHDVTAFLRSVTETLGPEGRWLHLGLTSNDVIDTAQALQLAEACDILDADLAALEEVLRERAIEFRDTLMIGRTHGVHAEPITFGLKLATWWDEVRRQRRRLAQAREEVAVGKISGAVGTHATVPPSIEERVCRLLGLRPEPFSSQVVHRDRHARLLTTLALIASSLERFATEIRHLQRTEVREVEEPFGEGQTGSSAMPHKRNPELSERVCGLARLLRGYAVTGLENVALWHERDISNSAPERITLPEATTYLDYAIDLFTFIVRGMRVFPQRMRDNLELTRGLVFSQRVMLALVEKGMRREEAYDLVQRHAMRCWDEGLDFRTLVRTDPRVQALLSPADLDGLFDYGYYTRYIGEKFRRAGLG
ncbi:MAG: adenylosuccinate lyase [Dehalococcoidia bacterium]|nr:adenylosuccinate lyase [Dehalococcoidia bacterium]MDW8120581.1 adenylosuccinate lyase [Chloroflexota bacterium]